jgi:hypothetical protein
MLASQRFAMLDDAMGFSLVLWASSLIPCLRQVSPTLAPASTLTIR